MFIRVLTKDGQFLKPVFAWEGHSMKINDLYLSPTSDLVVSASADSTCKVKMNPKNKR